MAIELKPHNQASYESALELFKKHDRVCIEQATTTGKSFVSAKIIESGKFKRVLFFAPNNYIIGQFKENFPFLNEKVYKLDFMTYSKTLHLKKDDINKMEYDLIILDEYHRLGAKNWGSSVNKILKHCSNAKIFGTTATPIRYLDDGRNMSKELFNGVVANRITLEDALKDEIIAKPKYVIGVYDFEKDKEALINKINKSIITNKEETREEVRRITSNYKKINGTDKILKRYITDERKFIVFCENVNALLNIKTTVQKWFKEALNEEVITYSVHSDQTTSDNKALFEEFKNSNRSKVRLLFVVDILNEGIHIKDIDGLIFLRNTESINIYYQQLGRGLVLNDKKSPIIFDFVDNSKSLGINYIYIDEKKSTNNYSNNKEMSYKNYTVKDYFDVYDETVDFLEIIQKIESNISNWEVMFEKIKAFYEKEGHFLVPRDTDENTRLNRWKNAQVTYYNDGKLSLDRVAKLNSINFPWNIVEEKWYENYSQLKEFKKKFGHVRPSKKKGDYKELGTWVHTQTKSYNKGVMPKHREKLLLKLGLDLFVTRKEREDMRWEKNLKELKSFLKRNPIEELKMNKGYDSLCGWWRIQKINYKRGKLEKPREEKIKKLGLSLDSIIRSEVKIYTRDLKIEYIGDNGKGVRITHVPTGIVAKYLNTNSKTTNKNKCIEVLRMKMQEEQDEK